MSWKYHTLGSIVLAKILLIMTIYGLAVVVNNNSDRAIDLANRRADILDAERDVPGYLRRSYVWLAIGTVIALQLFLPQPMSAVVTIGYTLLLLGYSLRPFRLSDRGLTAQVTLGLCYSSVPVLLATGYFSRGVAVTALLAMLVSLPFLLAKDYKDEVGDLQYGKRTPLIRYGASWLLFLSLGFGGLGLLLVHLNVPRLNTSFVLLDASYLWAIFRIHRTRGKAPIASQVFGLACVGLLYLR
jgi:4-hydroxybenzoate polyprenyltransferase